jgi:mRNA-degrading endonuclease RelE of RelBE toxin-antitoxin system
MNLDSSLIEETLKKLKKKDINLFKALEKKIIQISQLNYEELQHFKNLKSPLNQYKRIHVGSYVLMFKIEDEVIILSEFKHHDEAYK